MQLARAYESVIISADSRQVYREMTIGTAKPDESDLTAIPHYLVNHRGVSEPYSAADWVADALAAIEKLRNNYRPLIICGGTGLYFQGLVQGFDAMPEIPAIILEETQRIYDTQGIVALQEEVRLSDPDYWSAVDQDNPHRLLRAVRVMRASGKPFSAFRQGSHQQRNFTVQAICLRPDRVWLKSRIDQRVEQMVADGLEAEVKQLYPFRDLNALQTVGYSEWYPCIEGKLSREGAINLIKTHTHQYAKRQMTWFKKAPWWQWVDVPDDQLFEKVKLLIDNGEPITM